MAVPQLVRFLALTRFTDGLADKFPGRQQVVDGVGVVTKWLSTEGWLAPVPVSTTWSDVYTPASTTWTVIEP